MSRAASRGPRAADRGARRRLGEAPAGVRGSCRPDRRRRPSGPSCSAGRRGASTAPRQRRLRRAAARHCRRGHVGRRRRGSARRGGGALLCRVGRRDGGAAGRRRRSGAAADADRLGLGASPRGAPRGAPAEPAPGGPRRGLPPRGHRRRGRPRRRRGRGRRPPAAALAVVHVAPDLLQPLLDTPGAPRLDAALLRADLDRGAPLVALAVDDLLERGLRVAVLKRRLGWVAERRAGFGALGSDSGGLPESLLRRLLDVGARG